MILLGVQGDLLLSHGIHQFNVFWIKKTFPLIAITVCIISLIVWLGLLADTKNFIFTCSNLNEMWLTTTFCLFLYSYSFCKANFFYKLTIRMNHMCDSGFNCIIMCNLSEEGPKSTLVLSDLFYAIFRGANQYHVPFLPDISVSIKLF